MSNMTKTIAILGVVAGLGVAALPLSTYAAPATTEWKASDAEGYDANKMGGTGESAWVKTDATTVQLEINDKLSITASSTDTITLANATVGATAGLYENATPLTITVVTKNAGGYNLTMAGAGDTADSKKANSMYNATGDEIPAGAITGGVANASAATSTWGYSLAANATANSTVGTAATIETAAKYVAIPDASGAKIMSRPGSTPDEGDKVDVFFGANVISSQAAGVYQGKVVFTATNVAKAGA